MTALTSAENYAVASHILTDVSEAISVHGAAPETILREIARAQVYATLATVQAPPSQSAIAEAIKDVLVADGIVEYRDLPWDAAEAVGRLL